MAAKEPLTRVQLHNQIVEKAQADKNFKKALVTNPKKALGDIGYQVPGDLEVKVVEESAKVVYLVLPVNPEELTEEQMDAVAGGICWTNFKCQDKGCYVPY